VAAEREVRVPDIGDFEDVDVIEVLVAPGDRVRVEQSLITLESEKATMEIPSPFAGVVKELHVAVGDKVSEGSLILTLEVEEAAAELGEPAGEAARAAREVAKATGEAAEATREPAQAAREVERPAREVEAPARAARPPAARPRAAIAPAAPPAEAPAAAVEPAPPAEAPAAAVEPAPPAEGPAAAAIAGVRRAHASPSVRRLARELGVDLSLVRGSGPKQRIVKDDVQAFVRETLAGRGAPAPPAGFGLPPAPRIDFSKWGEVEVRPLHKVRRVAARNLHRSWITVPHVTQFDEADITDLEAFRRSKAEEAKRRGAKLTLLSFLIKAAAVVLESFPEFNSSLEPSGEAIVVKKYFHIGFAVDTDNGLVVPVIRDVDRKGLFELAVELAALSQKARDRKLSPEELAGGTFTISSLGGIGGTGFTPIVNAPEVAILGVSRAETKPVYRGGSFVPRLVLPISLSYDHRVIDGADAVRFTTRLKTVLGDIRNLIL
jgi:pyruvate dehydrogenase E2 component (dihydrolipoamide acetyltransferase)